MTILTDDLLASFDASVDRRRQGADHAAGDLHVRRVPGVRAPGAVRPRVAVRRARQPHPQRRRLLHHHRQRRADHRRPRQGRHRPRVLGDLPAPRHAGRRRRRQLQQVHLPVPPVELRPHRPAARRARDGAHRGVRQEGLPAAGAGGRAVAGLRVRQLRTPTPRRSAPTLATLRAVHRELRPRERGVSRHVHASRSAVELEGDVRELQRRLPRQQAAPHHPGLLPQRARRVPGRVDRRLERHLPHQRLHAHRRRVQRHHQGADAGVPEADRGRALALDVRAHAADAVLRHRARSGVLLHRAPEDRRHHRPRDRLPVPSHARSSTRCSITCSR